MNREIASHQHRCIIACAARLCGKGDRVRRAHECRFTAHGAPNLFLFDIAVDAVSAERQLIACEQLKMDDRCIQGRLRPQAAR